MFAPRQNDFRRKLIFFPLFFGIVALSFAVYRLAGPAARSGDGGVIHVISYSAFLGVEGPGAEIAKRFQAETGTQVDYLDSGDAGLLLKKMDLFPADLVMGFDQLTLPEAKASRQWRDLSQVVPQGLRWSGPDFMPLDWAPMAFIFRKGEIDAPKSLNDLLDARFKGAIALEDPRTSTPGLQFFFWVLDEMGVEPGFEFLKNLKPNLHSVAASWSAAYGAFTKKEAKLVFSYLTSPVFHWTVEKDDRYQPAIFPDGLPVQVEYVGIPQSCQNCQAAERFAVFLLKPETQRLIMERNYMFPVVNEVTTGSEFAKAPAANTREWKTLPDLLKRREELFDRWRQLGL